MWEDDIIQSAVLGSGNTKIIQTIVEVVKTDEALLGDLDFMRRIPLQNYDEAKKLEIVKYLLPLYCKEHQDHPGYYPLQQIFEMVVACCLCKNFVLTEFFISTFYSEKYNKLHPLIKKLEAAVEGSHYISILLHDEIVCLGDMADQLEGSTFEDLGFYVADHVERIIEIFIKLLLKNTPESMQLAVETMKVLVDKHFTGYARYFITCLSFVDMNQNVTLENPLMTKLAFKFIYRCFNATNQSRVYDLIFWWVSECPWGLKIYKQVNRFLNPFLIRPSPADEIVDELDDIATEMGPPLDMKGHVNSLMEQSRDAVRAEMAKNVESVKDFMDRIWSLNLPITVKCFLLYIPDPSWMDD